MKNLKSMFGFGKRNTKSRSRLEKTILGAEALEFRRVLTAYVVNTINDIVDPPSGPRDGLISLREAILASNSNTIVGDAPAGSPGLDTITFNLGSSLPATILLDSLQGSLGITEDLQINGNDPISGPVTIDGNLASQIFTIGQFSPSTPITVSLSNLIVTQGVSFFTSGGAILISNSTVTLNSVSVLNSEALIGVNSEPLSGGGISIEAGSNVNIVGGEISNNTASIGGGVYVSPTSTLSINGTLLDSNVAIGANADQGGGAIYNEGGSTSISSATISNNTATGAAGSGGGIFSLAGSVTVTNSTLDLNKARRAGGGIEVVAGTVLLTNTSLLTNDVNGIVGAASPGNGGGLHVTAAANVTVDGGSVSNNKAASEGGGLWNSATGTMTVRNGTIIETNEAAGAAADNGGGGIFNNGGSVIITGLSTTIRNNLATGTLGSGGGILNDGTGTVSVTDATITGNRANRAGGGIEATAGTTTNLTNVILTSNNVGISPAVAAPGNGGGLHITGNGNTTITGGQVNNNLAALEGGGLWNGSGTMTIAGGTSITGNTAAGAAADDGGGGIFNNAGTLNVSSATISNNTATGAAGSGGGILSLIGSVTVTNSTLDLNKARRAGGGIEVVAGTVLLTNTSLLTNDVNGIVGAASPGNGGGLHVTAAANVTVDGGSVSNNKAASEGGGLWNSATGTMTVRNGTIIETNEAAGAAADNGGGGIFNNGGSVIITGLSTTIRNNLATGTLGSGGGILNDGTGTVSVTDATITGNRANRAGGGIEATAGTTTNLTNVILTSNNVGVSPAVAAPGNGGGLHITGNGNTTITGGQVNNNLAALEGGGLWNGSGTMTIAGGTSITGNSARGAAADDGGGGIFNNGGTLSINSTSPTTRIQNNVASGVNGSGGGILSLGGTVTINNALISSNSAPAGGGIAADNTLFTLSNSTISQNGVNGILLRNLSRGSIATTQFNTNSVNDLAIQATTANEIVSVNDNSVAIGSAIVNYTGISRLGVLGMDGQDTFNVLPSTSVVYSLDGGNPTTSPGDTLNVDTGGRSSTVDVSSIAIPGFSLINFVNFESVQVTPALPLAVADTGTSAGSPITIDVLANDLAGPNPISITSFTQPSNGVVSFNSTSTQLIYSPNSGFSGTDNFSYSIRDSIGGTSSAPVSITVSAPPVQTIAQLTTGTGDGKVTLAVNGFGGFGSNVVGVSTYDPVGPIQPASTTFQSEVMLGFGAARQLLSQGQSLPAITLSSDGRSATSQFTIGSLRFSLTQTVVALTDAGGNPTGSELRQIFQITNLSSSSSAFELVRYLDGDLDFDNSIDDGGGRIVGPSGEFLFETDSGGTGSESTTFLGIGSLGGQAPVTNRFEGSNFPSLRSRLLTGAALRDTIDGDTNSDGFVDVGREYDITLALRNLFNLSASSTATYETSTKFGSGAPVSRDRQFETGSFLGKITKADLNKDGKIDVIVPNDYVRSSQRTSGLSIIFGATERQVNIPLPNDARPQSVLTGDFNGDGRLDLAVASLGLQIGSPINTNGVLILLQNTSGDFASPTFVTAGDGPVDVAGSDFNRDGKVDLVVANYRSNDVSILIGNGTGGFAKSQTLAAGIKPSAIDAVDFNLDGRADIAVANFESNSVTLLHDSPTGFVATTESIAAPTNLRFAKITSTLPSLIVSGHNELLILESSSTALTGRQRIPISGSLQGFDVADLDGDQDLDIAVINRTANSVVRLANNAPTFAVMNSLPVIATPKSVVIGDFNGNAAVEMLVGGTYRGVTPYSLAISSGGSSGGIGDSGMSEGEFTNPINHLDVNADGFISPLDVLGVVNALNAGRSLLASSFGGEGESGRLFVDVNGDRSLSPLDALLVINFLNLNINGEGESVWLQLSGQSLSAQPTVESESTQACSATEIVVTRNDTNIAKHEIFGPQISPDFYFSEHEDEEGDEELVVLLANNSLKSL